MSFAIEIWKCEFTIKQGFCKTSALRYLQIIGFINKTAQGLQPNYMFFVSKKFSMAVLIVWFIIFEAGFLLGFYLSLKISPLCLIRASYAPSKGEALMSKFFIIPIFVKYSIYNKIAYLK